MKLKLSYDAATDIPSGMEVLYTETDGKFILTEVEGMKTVDDVNRVQSALQKERNDHKALREKFKPIADKDPVEIVALLDRIPELEAVAAGKIDDDKINAIVDTRVKGKLTPLETKVASLTAELAIKEQLITEYSQKETDLVKSSKIRKAAKDNGIVDESILDDVVTLVLGNTEVTDDKDVILKDGTDLGSYFIKMMDKKPHWYGQTQGGGAAGSSKTGSKIINPFTNEHWNLTEQGKLLSSDPVKAQKMAEAAGTKIGAGRPPVKK